MSNNNRLRQIDDDLCAVERVQQIPVAAAAAAVAAAAAAVVKLASCISSGIITVVTCARASSIR